MSTMENMMQFKTAFAAGPTGNVFGLLSSAQKQNRGLSKLVTAIESTWAAIDRRRRERQATERLNQMDDHMLADIGIARSQIEFVVKNGRRPNAKAI